MKKQTGGKKRKYTHSHTQKFHRNIKVEAIIYKQKTWKVKNKNGHAKHHETKPSKRTTEFILH